MKLKSNFSNNLIVQKLKNLFFLFFSFRIQNQKVILDKIYSMDYYHNFQQELSFQILNYNSNVKDRNNVRQISMNNVLIFFQKDLDDYKLF